MTFCQQTYTLISKNFLLFRRGWLGSLCELLFPLTLMSIVVIIRRSVNDVDIKAEEMFFYEEEGQLRNDVAYHVSPDYSSGEHYQPYNHYIHGNQPFSQCLNPYQGPKCPIFATVLGGTDSPILNEILDIITSNFTNMTEYDREGEMVDKYNFSFQAFEDTKELKEYVRKRDYGNKESEEYLDPICIALQIEEETTSTIKLKLRYHSDDELVSNAPSTEDPVVLKASERYGQFDLYGYYAYNSNGFTYLINLLQNLVLRNLTGIPEAKIKMAYNPMPVSAHTGNTFLEGLAEFFPFFMVIMYIPAYFRLISKVVLEKEKKIRGLMKMMGLRDSAYWLSFLIYYIILTIIISILSTCLIIYFDVLEYIDWSLLLFLFIGYGISIFSFALFVSAFFTKTRTACAVGIMLYFLTYFVSSVMIGNDSGSLDEETKILLSLLPTSALNFGFNNILEMEKGKIGLTYENANEKIDNYRYTYCLCMLLADFLLYGSLSLYFDNIIPCENEVRKSPLYIFFPSYWRGSSHSVTSMPPPSPTLLGPNFEEIPSALVEQESRKECLKISNISKLFGEKRAVDHLSMTMYEGQIFALLGHNGAGKTTTLDVLTGSLRETEGEAWAYDTNVLEEKSKFRRILGICPQHDILLSGLTTREHLEMFGILKGLSRPRAKEAGEQLLRDLELEYAKEREVEKLSGGERRKLCICQAFIGNSLVIMLDEPTSGMDTSGRRLIWNILKTYKRGRVIILTTHHMDEADYLGDRIAIMSEGKLKCLGAPLFLKNRFGGGYSLSCLKLPGALHSKIGEFVRNKIGGCKTLSDTQGAITFQLPFEEEANFEALFNGLDARRAHLGIESYGIAITSLEEVFIKIGKLREGEDIADNIKENNPYNLNLNTTRRSLLVNEPEDYIVSMNMRTPRDIFTNYTISTEIISGMCRVFFLHLGALISKRIIHTYRNIGTLLIEVFVPIILVGGVLSFGLLEQAEEGSPVRWWRVSDYPTPQTLLYNTDGGNFSTQDLQKFINTLPGDLVSEGISVLPGRAERVLEDESDTEAPEHLSNPIEDPYTYIYNHWNSFHSAIQSKSSTRDPSAYCALYVDKLNLTSGELEAFLFTNITSHDSTPAFSNFIGETFIRAVTGNVNLQIRVASHPLPPTYETINKNRGDPVFILTMLLTVAFTLIPASIITYIVQEREDNLKHQQIISGVSLFAYWTSNGTIDLLKSLLVAGVAILCYHLFDNSIPYAWLFILLYSSSIIPFTYATSFLFKKESMSQNSTLFLHIFCGVLLGPVFFMLLMFKSTREYGDFFAWPVRLVPSFSFAFALFKITQKDGLMEARNLTASEVENELSTNVAGYEMWALVICFPLYFCIIYLLESSIWKLFLCNNSQSESSNNNIVGIDTNVIDEEIRVSRNLNIFAICSSMLRKVFRKCICGESVLAVQKVSFGVEYGECFALLGTNGAGKTTTFKMLTQDLYPSSGEVYIKSENLRKSFNKIRRLIGYCPQNNTLLSSLTVSENMYFYSKVKRIPRGFRLRLIQNMLQKLDLERYSKTKANNLSGGNKRKLSVAICLLGNPPIILLDEPSTGMDPQARRFMWEIIEGLTTERKNSAVILSTHSMEEAEALSTKMGIMVKGSFKCFGSPLHIKTKYGTGYELEIKLKAPEEEKITALLHSENMNNDSFISKRQFERIIYKLKASEILDELTSTGAASDFYKEFEEGKEIKGNLGAGFILQEIRGLEIKERIAAVFEEVRQNEHYNTYYQFGVSKSNRSIGDLFQFMCQLKGEFEIENYSVSQTSLEQIFNRFANEGERENMGKLLRRSGSSLVRSSTLQKVFVSSENKEKEGKKRAGEYKRSSTMNREQIHTLQRALTSINTPLPRHYATPKTIANQ